MQHSFVLLPEPHGRSLALLALRQTSLLGWSRAVLYKGVPYDLLREQQFTAGVHAVCIYAWVLPPAGMRAVCPWASRALVGQLMGKDGIVYRELEPVDRQGRACTSQACGARPWLLALALLKH
eukprot:scaffold217774_cov18-Tisochrysis_lutea.AAC.3